MFVSINILFIYSVNYSYNIQLDAIFFIGKTKYKTYLLKIFWPNQGNPFPSLNEHKNVVWLNWLMGSQPSYW